MPITTTKKCHESVISLTALAKGGVPQLTYRLFLSLQESYGSGMKPFIDWPRTTARPSALRSLTSTGRSGWRNTAVSTSRTRPTGIASTCPSTAETPATLSITRTTCSSARWTPTGTLAIRTAPRITRVAGGSPTASTRTSTADTISVWRGSTAPGTSGSRWPSRRWRSAGGRTVRRETRVTGTEEPRRSGDREQSRGFFAALPPFNPETEGRRKQMGSGGGDTCYGGVFRDACISRRYRISHSLFIG